MFAVFIMQLLLKVPAPSTKVSVQHFRRLKIWFNGLKLLSYYTLILWFSFRRNLIKQLISILNWHISYIFSAQQINSTTFILRGTEAGKFLK